MGKTGIEKVKFTAPCFMCKEPVENEALFNWDTTNLEPGQKIACPKCGVLNILQFDKVAWEKASREDRMNLIKNMFEIANQII